MKTDNVPPAVLDVLVALNLLTRLPMPHLPQETFINSARAAWAYPVAGCLTALVAGGAGHSLYLLGLPPSLCAGVVLALLMVITGAMHEDGLADTADGFWGGYTRERRLEIMKDSQIGAFGTLALIVIAGLRWICYAALLPVGLVPLITVAVVSRAMMPVVMHILPHARPNGLSQSTGRPGLAALATSLALGLAAALLCAGLAGVLVIIAALAAAGCVMLLANRKIGGQTGDVLGATQQLAEVVSLTALVAVLA
ncbi:MAG: adenosylcobinamide-GDP ribazoletransferase [Pseudomonadota bacterium]